MGWQSDDGTHEGYLVALVRDERNGLFLGPMPYRMRELGVHDDDGRTEHGVLHVKVACSCGWRSAMLAAPSDTRWMGFVATDEWFEDRAQDLWARHVEETGEVHDGGLRWRAPMPRPSAPVRSAPPVRLAVRTDKWFVTPFAVECFARVLRDTRGADTRAPFTRDELVDARDRLVRIIFGSGAGLRGTDDEGRELYRVPKSSYGIRWVVSHGGMREGDVPQVVWVGLGRPPARHWSGE